MSRSVVITSFVHREPDTSLHTAAYKIFYYEWDVMVPHMYVYDENYIRVAGTVVSDPTYDARLPSQMIGGRYTIAQMATLMKEGANIQLIDPVHAKSIYDIVAQHLEDWSNGLLGASSFDLNNVPMQDLMSLSRMADELYGYAARHFKHEAPRNRLSRRLAQIRGGARINSGRKFVDTTKPLPESERVTMPSHSDATQTILQKGSGRNQWS